MAFRWHFDGVRGVFEAFSRLFDGFRGGEIREIRLDKSKRSGTLFCHIEFGDSASVDRAIRLSGAARVGLRRDLGAIFDDFR